MSLSNHHPTVSSTTTTTHMLQQRQRIREYETKIAELDRVIAAASAAFSSAQSSAHMNNSNNNDTDKKNYYRKRNTLYARRKYYKRKLRKETVLYERDRLTAENHALRHENQQLEFLVDWAQEQVAVLESSGAGVAVSHEPAAAVKSVPTLQYHHEHDETQHQWLDKTSVRGLLLALSAALTNYDKTPRWLATLEFLVSGEDNSECETEYKDGKAKDDSSTIMPALQELVHALQKDAGWNCHDNDNNNHGNDHRAMTADTRLRWTLEFIMKETDRPQGDWSIVDDRWPGVQRFLASILHGGVSSIEV